VIRNERSRFPEPGLFAVASPPGNFHSFRDTTVDLVDGQIVIDNAHFGVEVTCEAFGAGSIKASLAKSRPMNRLTPERLQ